MALEDAKKLLQMIEEDEDLKQRLSKMTLEESLEYAAKSGLDVTIADLEEAAKPQEMSPEAMNEIAGGKGFSSPKAAKVPKCPNTPNGEHQWVITSREVEVKKILFWELHNRYDNWKCSACGTTRRTGA